MKAVKFLEITGRQVLILMIASEGEVAYRDILKRLGVPRSALLDDLDHLRLLGYISGGHSRGRNPVRVTEKGTGFLSKYRVK